MFVMDPFAIGTLGNSGLYPVPLTMGNVAPIMLGLLIAMFRVRLIARDVAVGWKIPKELLSAGEMPRTWMVG